MKSITARAAIAALAFGFVGISQAVPIQFEFSGLTGDGTRGTGQFLFETDELTQLTLRPNDWQSIFTDRPTLDRPTPVLGSFSVGSTTFSFGDNLLGGYGSVGFVDDCNAALECDPSLREGWLLNLYEQSFAIGEPAPDVYTIRSLSFTSLMWPPIERPAPSGFIDLATTRPEDILTLPLVQTTANYQEMTYDCSSGECVGYRNLDYTLAIDSVTRSVKSTSVPEPGTLGLFGAAFAGLFFARRRTTSGSTR